jgi:MoaA/NifB/PqqE/SkfB family radical SAM enzyme
MEGTIQAACSYLSMNANVTAMTELPLPRSEALLQRILGIQRLLEGLDPNLPRVSVRWAIRHPRHLPSLIRLARAHQQTSRAREQALENGMQVPPFLILSVTSRCNLRCAGCYAGAVGITAESPNKRPPLTLEAWRRVIEEASALGVVAFVIAGGEPFILPGMTSLFRQFSDRLFLVFTNGTAIEDRDFQALKRCRNTAVVVSVEGDRELTDERRGSGVYQRAVSTLDRLRAAGVLTGLSVTIGPANIDYWSQERNIDALLAHSGPLAFFIEQIPTGESQRPAIPAEQRARLRATVLRVRNRATGAAYLIHSPDDEEFFGGCVSAGRGFAHVTPTGDVTACPFSALATHNVSTATVSQAFASSFFTMIRDNGPMLETHDHPCSLFANAGKLESMAKTLGAYRTSASEPAIVRLAAQTLP